MIPTTLYTVVVVEQTVFPKTLPDVDLEVQTRIESAREYTLQQSAPANGDEHEPFQRLPTLVYCLGRFTAI